MSKPLAKKVCLVTGASRGIGKGIALGLAEQGAKIYITGRTASGPGTARMPGSLADTAAEIERLGGQAIQVAVDHNNDAAVKALFEKIYSENERLDVLVNNVFTYKDGFVGPKFWEMGPEIFDDVTRVGLRSHYVAACFSAPRMVHAGSGLIVNISSFGGINRYLFNVPYGLGKAAVDRMSLDMAKELRPHGVACLSLWPGIVRTERMQGLVDDVVRGGGKAPFDLADSESPLFTGRVIAAMAADPNVMRRSGTIQVVAEAARQYGVKDDDGTQPPSLRSLQFILPALVSRAIPRWLVPDIRIPFFLLNLRLRD